jgi:predicted permease
MAVFADLRYSIRSLSRSPGLAAALLLSIALGAGSNASVLGFIRGLVSDSKGIIAAGLVSVFSRDADGFGPFSYEDYVLFKSGVSAIESLSGIRESQSAVVIGGRSSVMTVAMATPEFNAVLELPASGGVLISRRLWTDEFGARTSVEGEAIDIDGRLLRVAGRVPDGFDGLYMGRAIDIWMPLDEASLHDSDRRSRTFWLIGRLSSGATTRSAEAAANSILKVADTAREPTAVSVVPYTGIAPDAAGGISRIGRLLPAAVGTVFLIACANVAGFLLSRASSRAQETSVRVALGASRRQLGTQLLADSVIVSLCGGALGVLLASWTMDGLPLLLFAPDAEELVFSPDIPGVVAGAAACAAITILCGLAPLFEVRDSDPAAVLRRDSGGLSHSARQWRAALVVGQMTCGCLLLISTGLLLEGFRSAMKTALGNSLGQPVIATVTAEVRFRLQEEGRAYFRRAEEAVQRAPGVASTAWVSGLPGGRPAWQALRIEPPPVTMRDVMMDVAVFPPKPPIVFSLTSKAGRMFGGRDGPRTCRVAIINEEAAAEFFNHDAVGRSIQDPTGQYVEIVGVIAVGSPRAPAGRGRPTVYYYVEQTGPPSSESGAARFRIPWRPKSLARATIDTNVVSPNYFDAVGLRLVAGRRLPLELEPFGCRVCLVNEAAAELYFGGKAVGGAFIDLAGHRTEILGIVQSAALRATQRRAAPTVFYPMVQNYLPQMTMILGTRDSSEELLASVRRQLTSVPGGIPFGMPFGPVVRSLDDHLRMTALAPERISTMLVGTCAATAMVLCLMGVYCAMADSVRRRRRDIALRIALGAQGWRVIKQVLWEGLRLAAAGGVAGIAGSWLLTRWLARVAPGSGSPAVWIWLAAPLVLAAVVAVASMLPARRALTVDPLVIMREDGF